jgi:putative acetyltransferase
MIEVRREAHADRAAVRRVNEEAFAGAEEAAIVDALRDAGAATLSLVAVIAGEVVGHILFSPVTIDGRAGDAARGAGCPRCVGLAPMAVLPAHQRMGVGSALVRAGLAELRAGGVVVVGHPTYYPRFGFVRASLLGLRWEHDCPDEAFMALELVPGKLGRGVVRYRPELGGG